MGKIIMKSRTGVPVPPSNSCTSNLRLAMAASKGLFGQAVKHHVADKTTGRVKLPKRLTGIENYNLTVSDPNAITKK